MTENISKNVRSLRRRCRGSWCEHSARRELHFHLNVMHAASECVLISSKNPASLSRRKRPVIFFFEKSQQVGADHVFLPRSFHPRPMDHAGLGCTVGNALRSQTVEAVSRPSHDLPPIYAQALIRRFLVQNIIENALIAGHEVFRMT